MTNDPVKRPRWLPILDRVSIAICAAAWIAAISKVAPAYSNRIGASALLLGLIAGYVLADFFSGLVHWIADRYFDPRTPILGPALIAPFREHHADVMAMTRHDFFELSGNNGLATVPLAAVLLWTATPDGFAALFVVASILSLGLSIIATNQFHCWAHAEAPPRVARRLQSWRIILTPERHALHHESGVGDASDPNGSEPEYDQSYCVTSGWLNPFLDRIAFFARLERRIDRLTRKPRQTA